MSAEPTPTAEVLARAILDLWDGTCVRNPDTDLPVPKVSMQDLVAMAELVIVPEWKKKGWTWDENVGRWFDANGKEVL